MKIVINRCSGGFALSDQARRLLYTGNSPHVTFTPEAEFWQPRADMDLQKHRLLMESLIRTGKYTASPGGYLSDDYHITWADDEGRRRTDSVLVAVVEELGDGAGGHGSKLRVVDVPGRADWLIHDCDGKEQIRTRGTSFSRQETEDLL